MQILSFLLILVNSVTGIPMTPYLSLPPSWENRVIYYQSFDDPDKKVDINKSNLHLTQDIGSGRDGIRGFCGAPDDTKTINLKGVALSPHQPLAVSFWWKLGEDANEESSFGLFHLTNGRGFVSHFARTGPWCALKEPAGVLQVYYLQDIQNINGIYDREILENMELKAGVWHHTVLVFRAGSSISLYTDGKKVHQVRLTGRSFQDSDQLHELTLGSQSGLTVSLDEIMILNRPLSDGEIQDYYQAITQMQKIDYPLYSSGVKN